jgi:ketosteroid isomerase-like protein
MSQENVEIVKRYYEDAANDPEQMGAEMVRAWKPDGDYYPVRKFPEAGPCHGREQIVDFLTEYMAAWDAYRNVVKEVRAIGDVRVFVHAHFWAEGRASGVAMEGDLYHCCWLRHGRFIRVEDHLTEKGALHALGLGAETLEAAGLTE